MNKKIDKQPEEFLKINYKGKSAKVLLRLIGLEDHEYKICYIPSLELSSYGNTFDEAKKMMNEVLHDFFECLFKLPEYEVVKELNKYGWKRKSNILKKEFENTSPFIDKDGILNNFNLPKETKIKEEFISL